MANKSESVSWVISEVKTETFGILNAKIRRN